MDDNDDNFDSPQAIMEMKRRHLQVALEMQRIGAAGLAELRERGDLSADQYAELLAEGLKLERTSAPNGSKRRH